MKKAFIIDLDNTIYPVKSVGDKLFAPLFQMIEKSNTGLSAEDMQKVKEDIMRKPFQVVADKYSFDGELTKKGIDLLKESEYDFEMIPFEDYLFVKEISADKFLVTTGFSKLQLSKVTRLGIANDFKEIFIVDPATSEKTKKDIFSEIMKKYNFQADEVLVVGDDPESEIKAAKELNIETFLIDKENQYSSDIANYKTNSLKDLLHFQDE